jgi:hypothetical protein
MRKDRLIITGLISAFLFCFSALKADHLDGLWQNDRQDITIRIEQDDNSFRAKRIDQGIWYDYVKQDDNTYVDRNGNWYEIINEDELEWNESRTHKSLIFRRVDSRENDQWRNGDDPDDNWDPRDRSNSSRWDTQDKNRIEGRWYDRSTKERLIIEAINNGYRVRTHHGGWEQFAADRSGKRLRSRSGDVIQLIDPNRLRMISDRGRHESIFIRQGNGYQHDKVNKEKGYKDKGYKDRSHKCDHKGKSCCG